MSSTHESKTFSDISADKIVECQSCYKKVNINDTEKVYFSLKRNNSMKPQLWCDKCMYLNKDEFCPYCNSVSFGTIPCSGCRSDYM